MLDTTDIAKLKQDLVFQATLLGKELTFHSTWGLFNPKSIDEGTLLLLEHLELNPTATILDLGCGFGAIGLAIAKTYPQATVHLIDKDFVAIEYAKKNALANKISNVEIYLSNGFSLVPRIGFDLVISNLPAKVGKELLYVIMSEAKDYLKPGGKLMVVTISGLKEYIKRQFKEIFGNYDKVKHSNTYIVSVAQKNS